MDEGRDHTAEGAIPVLPADDGETFLRHLGNDPCQEATGEETVGAESEAVFTLGVVHGVLDKVHQVGRLPAVPDRRAKTD